MVLIIGSLFFVALGVQLLVLRRMGARRPIGDEAAYIGWNGTGRDPPQAFIRPPGLLWIARLCRGEAGATERRLRVTMGVASVLTVVLTTLAGYWVGGVMVAALGGFVILVSPERLILGCHVWPDTFLACLIASLAAITAQPYEALSLALAAGGLAAIGVMIRIDFLIVPPVLAVAWWFRQDAASGWSLLLIVLPAVIVLIGLSIRNRIRYGVTLPDTTWAFNMLVMSEEASREDEDRVEHEALVVETYRRWKQLPIAAGPVHAAKAAGRVWNRPGRLGRSVLRRLATMVGPDTFVRQKLLPERGAYPGLGEHARRRWSQALVLGFPTLVAVVIVSSVATWSVPAPYAWPGLATLAAPVLFHARTRFRLATLPALSVLAAEGLTRFSATFAQSPITAIAFTLAIVAITVLLARFSWSTEVSGPAA